MKKSDYIHFSIFKGSSMDSHKKLLRFSSNRPQHEMFFFSVSVWRLKMSNVEYFEEFWLYTEICPRWNFMTVLWRFTCPLDLFKDASYEFIFFVVSRRNPNFFSLIFNHRTLGFFMTSMTLSHSLTLSVVVCHVTSSLLSVILGVTQCLCSRSFPTLP